MSSFKKIFLIFIFFISVFSSDSFSAGPDVEFLSTLEEHQNILREAFEIADDRIVITSPFISELAINNDHIKQLIIDAIKRGVQIKVYTDDSLDADIAGNLKDHAEKGRSILMSLFCDFYVVHNIHAKTLIVDDKWMVSGSFNWLSASRDEGRARLEHSIVSKNKSNINKSLESIYRLDVKRDLYRINYESIFRIFIHYVQLLK